MKALLTTLALMLPVSAMATPLMLDEGYLHKDGAIQTYYKVPERLDPYFPTKGLLLSMDTGMNNEEITKNWIGWMIRKQEPNGLFSRFCLNHAEQDYQSCMSADADDSMMAMWIELLYRAAPESGLPVAWRHSLNKAEDQLEALRSPNDNIYYISKQLPVGLFMDNIEIYAAFRHAAKEAREQGDLRQSSKYYAKAARLKSGIMQTFWDDEKKQFTASTQERKDMEFYPDIVAQLFPVLHSFQAPKMPAPQQTYAAWMQEHKQLWFSTIGHSYPWGLLAVVATRYNDFNTANCWLQISAPYRHSKTWDVMDEAAYQSVELRLKQQWPAGLPKCDEVRA